MTERTLEELSFGWSGHRAALWWLGVLYRRPQRLRAALEPLNRGRQLLAGGWLVAHAFPWAFLLAFVGRVVAFEALGLPTDLELPKTATLGDHALWSLRGVVISIAGGLTGGIPFGSAIRIGGGLAGGIVFGMAFGIAAVVSLLRVYYLPGHFLFTWLRAPGHATMTSTPLPGTTSAALPFPVCTGCWSPGLSWSPRRARWRSNA